MTRRLAPAAAFLAIVIAATFAPAAAAQQSSQPTALPCPTQPSAAPQSSALPSDTATGQPSTTTPPPSDAWHCVTVKFAYDFTKTPPCTGSKPKHPCVAQFAIYDTTAGTGRSHRTFLFDVALPAAPSGVVPISGQSPKQIDFALGWHKLGVGALDDTGKDSHMKFCDSCATWVDIEAGPSSTPSAPAPGTSDAPPGTPPSSPTPAPAANH